MAFRITSGLINFAMVLGCGMGLVSPSSGQSAAANVVAEQQKTDGARGQQPADPPTRGNIGGTVFDESGAVIGGARVRLTPQDPSLSAEVLSGADGQFSFPNVVPGPFQLTITSSGFATQVTSGVLHPGEIYTVPKIALVVATNVTDVEVELTQEEVAEEQIHIEEKQRVLGFIPNFYVSYLPNPAPLTSKQKFELAWKTSVDPITFLITGAVAGIQQADDDFDGYGQGASGYAKRYGASYADGVAGTFIGAAILPSLLKQDPRYFYKGTGSWHSRALYAMANAVICKGDNGRWEANYSNIIGSLAAGGISNIYYPAKDREGAELTIDNGLIGIGATAAGNLFQEFLVRKLTPKSKRGPIQQ
jgi:hypothetical protein